MRKTPHNHSNIRTYELSNISNKGFTLVEMLVVIAIIAILLSVAGVSYSAFIARAQKARGNELVQNVKTALVAVLQADDSWPRALLNGANGKEAEMTADVGGILAKRGVLSLSYKKTTNATTGETLYQLTGIDQCGIVTPWATDVIKKKLASGSVPDSTRVPSGGTVKDHRLRFALDDDYDGYTDVALSCTGKGGGARVRASACVWCCGYDGVFGTKDDIFSWTPGQEER